MKDRQHEKMRKVLVVITTGFDPYGGLTTVMMNYFREMNKDGLQIDFASCNELTSGILKSDLDVHGSLYYCLGDRKKDLPYYIARLRHVLKNGKYDVIHINGNSATMAIELCVARHCGVAARIAHGHTTRSGWPILHKMLQPVFKHMYTLAISVSRQAGDWLFGTDKYIILNNAIATDRYQYDETMRKKVRSELQLEDRFVVGNVGKLNGPKNHRWLIEIFDCIRKRRPSSHLLIVGGGELEEELKRRCGELGISGDVTFTGMQEDASIYLQAMDTFVFPSVFEGMSLALIEAQAAGLYCFVSDTQDMGSKLTENVEFISLNDSSAVWAERILAHEYGERRGLSEIACASIGDNGFSIKKEADVLRKIYMGQK